VLSLAAASGERRDLFFVNAIFPKMEKRAHTQGLLCSADLARLLQHVRREQSLMLSKGGSVPGKIAD
jgi:hypothetical protein